MSLTLSPGPLSGRPPTTRNYEIDGPAHKLLFTEFPRRIHATFAGRTVLDTERGMLLHETGLLPQLYVPDTDLDAAALVPTEHHTHCPFKGDASYLSLRVGERIVENAVWSYPDPPPAASWLAGHSAFYWDAVDAWFDEDEQVFGHLRDPYHAVDVRSASRHVRVLAGDVVVADTRSPVLLSETGLPNRLYVSPADIRSELLESSERGTVCPYKGSAGYFHLRLPDRRIEDVGWCYEQPFDAVRAIAGRLCFDHDELAVQVQR